MPEVLVRGGEPFLFPGIIELLEYLLEKGIATSVDTNGTMLERYAADLVRLGDVELTISVDGPEAVHDAVRGINGSFRRIEHGLIALRAEEEEAGKKVRRANETPWSAPSSTRRFQSASCISGFDALAQRT